MSAPAEHAEHGAAEPDNPHVLVITVSVLFVVGFLALLVAGTVELFSFAVRDQNAKDLTEHPNSALRELHAKEAEHLTGYQYVDKAKGIVRLPLDRAVAVTLRDWDKRPGGVKSLEPTPVPAPVAPSAAPTPK